MYYEPNHKTNVEDLEIVVNELEMQQTSPFPISIIEDHRKNRNFSPWRSPTRSLEAKESSARLLASSVRGYDRITSDQWHL
jgi:hypothetical protein